MIINRVINCNNKYNNMKKNINLINMVFKLLNNLKKQQKNKSKSK